MLGNLSAGNVVITCPSTMSKVRTVWCVQALQCYPGWLQDMVAPDENA